MRSYLLLAAMLLGSAAQAQTDIFQLGYIVRTSAPADTVRGYIDVFQVTNRNNVFGSGAKGYVLFRSTADAPPETLRAADITAAGTADGRQAFRTRPLPDNIAQLLEVVADGPLTLYTGYSFRSDADFFLEQQGSKVLPLPKGQLRPVLQGVAWSCSTYVSPKQRYAYSRKSLATVTDAYNRCKTGQSRLYPGVQRRGLVLRARAGVQSSQLVYQLDNKPFGQYEYSNKLGPVAAVQLDIPIVANLSAAVEAIYSQPRTTGQYTSVGRNVRYTGRATLGATLLQVPVLLRWQFSRPERNLQPFAAGGYGGTFALDGEGVFEELNPDGTVRTSSAVAVTSQRALYHYGAGASVRTLLGRFGLALHQSRARLGAPALGNFRLRQTDVSLLYSW